MGEVYAAFDPKLNRKVAIKMLRVRSGDAVDASLRLRMMREAQAIAKVSHPNVIVVHDVGTFGPQVFVAMEFVEGQTLSEWLLEITRPWPDVLRMFSQAGRGLAAAHEKDLVHRDFKPDNVMIGVDGQVRVMDFGLARTVAGPRAASTATPVSAGGKQDGAGGKEDSAGGKGDIDATRVVNPLPWSSDPSNNMTADVMSLQITQMGAVIGTPAYMAPEQFLGHDTDARTDQFSFCVALYEGLYRERPFPGQTPAETKASVLRGQVDEPASRNGVPPGVRKLILRGLMVDPQQRWPSMKALLQALEDNRLFTGRRWLASGASAKLRGVWEAPVRRRPVASIIKSEMHRAFLATQKPYAEAAFAGVSRILDSYADRWSAMYVDICEATHVRGEQSPEVLDLRMACLLDCLEELRALTRIFRHADADVVENAITAASALAGLDRCADVTSLRAGIRPPQDHPTRAAVEKVRARLAEVRVLAHVGRYAEGLAAVGPLQEEARRIGYGPLLAETSLVLGRLHLDRREIVEAARALEEAVWTAELHRHEEVVAEAAAHLVYVIGEAQLRFDVAEIWCRLAETVLQRMGGHHAMWGWLLNNRGVMRHRQGRFVEALDDMRRALAAKEKAGGPKSPDVALSLNNLALSLIELGEISEAATHLERALAIVEEGLGPRHPKTGLTLSNYAEGMNLLGRFAEARAAATRALEILEPEPTAGDLSLTFPLVALGVACLGAGSAHDALPILERAGALRDAYETDPACLGEIHFALACGVIGAGGAGDGRSRALALVERARSEYARAPRGPVAHRALAKIDAWLMAMAPPPG